MKVIIDCSLISTNMRGMGIYLLKIIPSIRLDLASSYTLITNNKYGKDLLSQKFINDLHVKVVYLQAPLPIYEQLLLPIFALIHRTDLLIGSGNTGAIFKVAKKQVLLIHDVFFLKKDKAEANNLKRKVGRLYRKLTVTKAAKKADYIITVSNFAKDDIQDELGFNSKNIFVIPNGVDASMKINGAILEKKEKRILFVSGSDRQKNLQFYLPILLNNQSIKKNFKSVEIIGVNSADELGIPHDSFVNYHGFVEHDKAKVLYRSCSHFVIPSLYESFGIPAIEALISGCKVFASNTGALPEVLEDMASYFSPTEINSIELSISEINASEALDYDELIQQVAYVQKFYWERSIKLFLEFVNGIR
jgi:glycosyltransferase involved in cell wall biosynthesis